MQKSKLVITCAASALALGLGAASAQSLSHTIAFDIEPQPLEDALIAFSDQSGVQVIASAALLADKQSGGVLRSVMAREALDELLNDTGLAYQAQGAATVSIVQLSAFGEGRRNGSFRTAQATLRDAGAVRTPRERADSNQEGDDDVDTIIVTGTNIRGIQNSASPLTVITREDIDRQGFTTTQQLLRSLPQNLDAGENSSVTATNVNGSAEIGTVGVNVRGLGVGTTLTLVNGRRIAAGGGSRQITDVSLIPLSAIERVEVLTDGASAIYGTDAIAGVINFILREDFEGAETRFRFGGVTEGSSQEYQASQTLGAAWNGGNVIASYEYYRRNNLDTRSKPFTEDAPDPSDILPQTQRHSLFLTGNQDISDTASIFANGFYSVRDTDSIVSAASSLLGSSTTTRLNQAEQYGATLGANIELGGDWQAEFAGAFNTSRSDNDLSAFPSGDAGYFRSNFDLWTADAQVDGPIFSLPAGSAKVALGAQYRSERFKSETLDNFDVGRDIYAVFAEIYAPIIGESNRRPGVYALDVTAAGRFEDYSDFGSSLDPKVGLRYAPVEGLNIRGTYGTSFRAPNFFELEGVPVAVALPGVFLVPPAGQASAPNLLSLDGPNFDLGSENSRTWTVGLDYAPPQLDGLSLKATYFDIQYDERIAAPLTTGLTTLFPNQALLGPLLVLPDDPGFASLVSENFPTSPLFNPFGLTPDDIGAFFDGRIQNIASTNVTGIDFSVDYVAGTNVGEIQFGVNGSYLFEFLQQNLPDAPASDTLNRQGNPVDLRLRSTVGWALDNMTASVFVNYVDSYQSDFTGELQPVASWTTVDINAAYRFDGRQLSKALSDARISFNVINLFNEDPPFIDRTMSISNLGQNFDGANANALGRVVSIQLEKAF